MTKCIVFESIVDIVVTTARLLALRDDQKNSIVLKVAFRFPLVTAVAAREVSSMSIVLVIIDDDNGSIPALDVADLVASLRALADEESIGGVPHSCALLANRKSADDAKP